MRSQKILYYLAMSQITSLYVYKVLQHVNKEVEVKDLLEKLGLSIDGPIDPLKMVLSSDYYDFFAKIVSRDPDGLTLPLRIGASMKCEDYGAFGLAWKSAPNLKGSFIRGERYSHVLGNAETYSLQKTKGGLFFNLEKSGNDCAGRVLSNEASIAAVDIISKEVSTVNFESLGVYFKHTARGDIKVYEKHFGCPVYFETGRDALFVSEESIEVPNIIGDKSISSFFDRHLETELAHQINNDSLEQKVRHAVVNRLSEGVPTISEIATELGIGARTLQRRLTEQGHSFQSVVDLARKDLAQRLLRETDYNLAEIAFLTGFSEQSGFTRAFKRWASKTPRSYRLEIN